MARRPAPWLLLPLLAWMAASPLRAERPPPGPVFEHGPADGSIQEANLHCPLAWAHRIIMCGQVIQWLLTSAAPGATPGVLFETSPPAPEAWGPAAAGGDPDATGAISGAAAARVRPVASWAPGPEPDLGGAGAE